MKSVKLQSKVQSEYLDDPLDDLFHKSLYRSSNLLRIVLRKPISQLIGLGEWNRINIKLVTEMGLPVFSHTESIELSGKILINQSGYYQYVESIETRPITLDNWEPEMARFEGFNAFTSLGALEYRINLPPPPSFYITLQATTQKILPLCLGPFEIIKTPTKDCYCWPYSDNGIQKEQQQYRALSICREQYFLIKEQWEDGMPGKIWDSALVVVNILLSNPRVLSGKRILDLSAGTGYIGLSIAQLFQTLSEETRPWVILSDVQEALELIKTNQRLNHIQDSPRLMIEPLYWGNVQSAQRLLRGQELDIIIASDIIYRKSDFTSILSAFRQLCSAKTIIYLGYKTRGLKPSEEKEFFDRCNIFFHVKLLDYCTLETTDLYNFFF